MGLLIGFVALPLIYYSKFLIDFSCFSLFTGIWILQEEIHELLLSFAEVGATVVRLKGGDPLVSFLHAFSCWCYGTMRAIGSRKLLVILIFSQPLWFYWFLMKCLLNIEKLSILQNKFLLYVLTDMWNTAIVFVLIMLYLGWVLIFLITIVEDC